LFSFSLITQRQALCKINMIKISKNKFTSWFNVPWTVHNDINFEAITNLMHKYLYSYNITILYMFRALICSSSGGSIVYVQHLVPSLSVSGRMLLVKRELDWAGSLLTSVTYGHSQRVTVPDAVHIQLNLLKMSIIMLETCRGLWFFFLALQPPLGVVFYSPLAGFSLLAYEVSWSHTTTRHSR